MGGQMEGSLAAGVPQRSRHMVCNPELDDHKRDAIPHLRRSRAIFSKFRNCRSAIGEISDELHDNSGWLSRPLRMTRQRGKR
jgi:hypothetical protein